MFALFRNMSLKSIHECQDCIWNKIITRLITKIVSLFIYFIVCLYICLLYNKSEHSVHIETTTVQSISIELYLSYTPEFKRLADTNPRVTQLGVKKLQWMGLEALENLIDTTFKLIPIKNYFHHAKKVKKSFWSSDACVKEEGETAIF